MQLHVLGSVNFFLYPSRQMVIKLLEHPLIKGPRTMKCQSYCINLNNLLTRNCNGCFCTVCGKDHLPALGRLKDPPLLLHLQFAMQLEADHVGVLAAQLAAQAVRVAGRGHKHEDVTLVRGGQDLLGRRQGLGQVVRRRQAHPLRVVRVDDVDGVGAAGDLDHRRVYILHFTSGAGGDMENGDFVKVK